MVLFAVGALDAVSFAVSLGALVAVPLGIEIAGHGACPGWRARLLAVWPLAAAGCVVSWFDEPAGILATLGSFGYLGFCLAVGGWGLSRLVVCGRGRLVVGAARRGRAPEIAESFGCLMLPVAGAWLVAERMGWTVLGFSGLWAGLTAAHFHFAGFATPIVLGLGYARAGEGTGGGAGPRRHGNELLSLVVGVPCVALGITWSPELAFVGTLLTALPILSHASRELGALASAGRGRRSGTQRLVALMRLVSALVPLVSMPLALIWSLSVVVGQPWLQLGQMVRYHGLSNAVGFVSLGLCAELMARRSAR